MLAGNFSNWLRARPSSCNLPSLPISTGRLVSLLSAMEKRCSCCNSPISGGNAVSAFFFKSSMRRLRNSAISAGRRVIFLFCNSSFSRCSSASCSRGSVSATILNSSAQAIRRSTQIAFCWADDAGFSDCVIVAGLSSPCAAATAAISYPHCPEGDGTKQNLPIAPKENHGICRPLVATSTSLATLLNTLSIGWAVRIHFSRLWV